jgi:integrase
LTREEVARLIEAVEEPHVRLFIFLGLYTGARTRALLGLHWDDIDFKRQLIVFTPAHPQSRKRTAVVPISQTLHPELRAAQDFAETPFVIEYRGRPVNSVKKGFREAVRRAGIDYCTPHDLRRTCATWMIQAGVPTARVARFLGDSETMIERVYGHHAPDYLQVAVAALDGDDVRNLRAIDAA